MSDDYRPDPDSLLKAIQRDEKQAQSGKLRIFFGMSAGVGKTFAMLRSAHQHVADGDDVIIGTVDTHGRKETLALVEGLEILPRKKIEYKGATLTEMDLDAILSRKPKIVLVDELAHTNAPGSRHNKRYQDVLEILDSGIDVYTTVNVQHLESRKEAIEQISGVTIRETIPDSLLERAAQIDLIDISPRELLRRLKEGKVYLGDRAEAAQKNFFKEGTLTALREIALRMTAEKVDNDLQGYMLAKQIQGPWKTGERLMVAVSHSPYSERLIRATRRISFNLEAPWVAVHIDTGLKLGDVDSQQLAKNLNLVRELGGELLSTVELDLPNALQRIAKQKNITQIIIGRPTRRIFKNLIEGGSLLDRLVRESGDFDVHVIRQDSPKDVRPNLRVKLGLDFHLSHYWNVAWTLAAVSLINWGLLPFVGYKAVGFIYLIVTLTISLFVTMGPILFAALASVLLWDYLFIPPSFTFLIRESDDFLMCGAYLIAALITGFLTNRTRQHERVLREREERSALLYEIVSDIANAETRTDFIRSIRHRMSRVLEGETAVFLRNSEGKLDVESGSLQMFNLDEKENAVAAWALNAGKVAGWSTDTLNEASALYIPLKGRSSTIGIFAFKPKNRKDMSPDRNELLRMVSQQLAVSIERDLFEDESRENQKLHESEELHQTLLNSVSHELRTPLTAVIGVAQTLARDLPQDDARGRELAAELVHSGERLNMVVENLLDMTRLNSGVHKLKREWNDIHDLVGVVLRKLGPHADKHKISTEIDENLPLVEFDFRLLEHAVFNIVHNAVLYTPQGSEIRILGRAKDDVFHLIIEDKGPGVPDEHLKKIFEKFHRAPGTKTGGTGLGLAIAKSIVELHGGQIEATNADGLHVEIKLPVSPPPKVENEPR